MNNKTKLIIRSLALFLIINVLMACVTPVESGGNMVQAKYNTEVGNGGSIARTGYSTAGTFKRAINTGNSTVLAAEVSKEACINQNTFKNQKTNINSKKAENKWQKRLDKYLTDENVNQLIFVKHKKSSKAQLVMYDKQDGKWVEILNCPSLVGLNGIDKVREGDMRTPTGDFTPTFAFGIKKDPGTAFDYVKLNKNLYWSGSQGTYNTMVDKRKYPNVIGEHLIEHNPSYTYALDIGYNTKCVYKKGSAIFLHCYGKGYYKGKYTYTWGCVAVSKKEMKFILRHATPQMKICIHDK
ncbi:MAG: L,D-transpeptidase family protein [Lachnospiraceae bacterium]|nr:L,D-transpeptidase family protein [Lachnospiraceae bacterium]